MRKRTNLIEKLGHMRTSLKPLKHHQLISILYTNEVGHFYMKNTNEAKEISYWEKLNPTTNNIERSSIG